MMICEILLLCCACVLCGLSVWTDLRHGQIKNKHLVVGFTIGLALNIVYYAVYCRDCLGITALNLFISALLSIGFYFVHIWSAGDSKLLIVLISLLPGRLFWANTDTIVPAAYLFILVFSIGYLYLIGEAVYLDFKKHAIKLPTITKAGAWTTIKSYFHAFIVLYAWNSALSIAVPSFVENNIHLLSFISNIQITDLREKPVNHTKILIGSCIILDVVMLVLTRNSITAAGVLRMAQTYLLVLLVMWTTWIAGKYVYESVPTADVKAGMILSKSTVVCFAPSRVKGLPQISYEDMRSRLTEEEAAAVRRWKDSKYGKETVVTVRKIPFASFIAVGVLLFAAYHIAITLGLWGI